MIEVDSCVDETDQLAGRDGRPMAVPAWMVGLAGWLRTRGQRIISPLWRIRYPALVFVALIAVAVALRPGQGSTVPLHSIATVPESGTQDPAPPVDRPTYRSLVVPASVRPGQTMTVVGYQRRGVCEATTLVYLDLQPVGHEVLAVVDAALPDWDGIVLSVRVPTDITAGVHVVSLIGALPRPDRGADICTDTPQHTGTLASALFSVEPPS
jgi:hypothetical protein